MNKSIKSMQKGYNIVKNVTCICKSTETKITRFVSSRHRNFRGESRSISSPENNFHYDHKIVVAKYIAFHNKCFFS